MAVCWGGGVAARSACEVFSWCKYLIVSLVFPHLGFFLIAPFPDLCLLVPFWPVKAKFYVKHLKDGETNVYIDNLGHMTKMAAMPIYGKNPSKSSSLKPMD